MKNIRALCLAATGVVLLLCGYLDTQPAARAQTQAQMDERSYRDFLRADKHLNKVYRTLLAHLNPITRHRLVVSERAWVAYRDAESDYQAQSAVENGTMYPCLYNGTSEALTDDRIKEFRDSLASQHAHIHPLSETKEEAYRSFLISDKQLGKVYKKTMTYIEDNIKDDPDDPGEPPTKQALVLSERTWLAFRGTEATFVAAEDGGMYSSAYYYRTCKEMTDSRIKDLDQSMHWWD